MLSWAGMSAHQFPCQCIVQNIHHQVDLPDPDTPVMQTNLPKGMVTSIFFKLFSCAPLILSTFPLPLRLACGSGTCFFSRKISACQRFCFRLNIFGSPFCHQPAAVLSAPRPASMIQSAFSMVSSSCSTTKPYYPDRAILSRLPKLVIIPRV